MSHCLVLTFTTLMALYCFVTCVVTDPGRVPDKWTPRSKDAAVVEVKKTVRSVRCSRKQQSAHAHHTER